MKKNIGLAIVYKYPDYGSMLQALSTQLVLNKLGYNSEAINITDLQKSINKRKYRYFLQNIYDTSIVKEKSKIIFKKIRTKIDAQFAKNVRIRESSFIDFSSKYFKESRIYESWDDLKNACRNYDAVLVGSDQLWLPSNVYGDYYTLNFVPKEIKKISYATSFGISSIPAKYKVMYSNFLNRINYLSARESSGQQIIENLTGRDVPLVCDPALLQSVEDWNHIATKERLIKEKYIFCYFMGDNPEQRLFARRMANLYGYKIVALLHLDQYIPSDENYVDYAPYRISPADFINLIKYAEYVFTDSFHGTVFSIIYSKDFFTFKRFNRKASLSTNTRIYSLLDNLHLSSRLFSANEDINADWHIYNYEEIHSKVDDLRKASIDYLINSIEN